MTEETTEIIETTPAPMQMPVVDPMFMPLLLPFMLLQQISLMLMQMPQMTQPMMQMPQMMQTMGGQAQQTIVKLGYDKDGNVTSVYERRW